MGEPYDPHAPCKREIAYWQQEHADKQRIKEVVLETAEGVHSIGKRYQVLQIIRVDAFKDGLRILVR